MSENSQTHHLRKASRIAPSLAKLLTQYHQTHWLASDPIQYPHRYRSAKDQEVAAFIAACFAYGSVQLVHRAVSAILAPMGESPAAFVKNYNGTNYWPGFYHRFHHDGHVQILIRVLQSAIAKYGSLGEMFRQNQTPARDAPALGICERVLDGAATWLRTQALSEIKSPDLARGMRFFFNSPSDGSACKRMVMFMRWMVRHDDIDLGLWDWFPASELVIPADTHVARISYYLRLRGGKEKQAPNWKMAREITASLKRVNPEDPVCYDFAIARLGILDVCKRKYQKSICERCPVEPGCRFSNMKARARCA
jgi:uncharacterized protein (TIGR02757 family)